MKAKISTLIGLAVLTLATSVVGAPGANAGPKNDRPVRFETYVVGGDLFYVEEDTEAKFAFTGIAKGQNVRAVWSDGGETVIDTSTGCTAKKARALPKKCIVTASHKFTVLGEGTVVLFVDGGAPRSSARVSIHSNAPEPEPVAVDPNTPPRDWATLFEGGVAGFAPCDTITWSFDGTTIANHPDLQGLPGDVQLGLSMLSEKSGLTFVQQDGYDVDLRFSVGQMHGEGWLGYFSGAPGSGNIVFSDVSPWMKDTYAGARESIRVQVDRPDLGPGGWYVTTAGRVWTVIHETMHALGFGHIDNGSHEVMNSALGPGGWGAGDLEGLATLYPRTNCPA